MTECDCRWSGECVWHASLHHPHPGVWFWRSFISFIAFSWQWGFPDYMCEKCWWRGKEREKETERRGVRIRCSVEDWLLLINTIKHNSSKLMRAGERPQICPEVQLKHDRAALKPLPSLFSVRLGLGLNSAVALRNCWRLEVVRSRKLCFVSWTFQQQNPLIISNVSIQNSQFNWNVA